MTGHTRSELVAICSKWDRSSVWMPYVPLGSEDLYWITADRDGEYILRYDIGVTICRGTLDAVLNRCVELGLVKEGPL